MSARNRFGVKDSIDCYRTIKGERYVAWLVNPTQDCVAAYRAAGIKCRRINGELFIRFVDQSRALDEIEATPERFGQ